MNEPSPAACILGGLLLLSFFGLGYSVGTDGLSDLWEEAAERGFAERCLLFDDQGEPYKEWRWIGECEETGND